MAFLYSLRLGRWGVAGFSAVAFVLTLLQGIGFYAISGSSAAARAAFGRSMLELAPQFTVLIPTPIRPDTAGGYVQWRAYSFFAIVFAIWAIASAAGAIRGDEDRGLVEQVLATGTSRADALIARFFGFVAGCIVAVLAAALGVLVAAAYGHDTIGIEPLAGASVNLLGLALCCYALAALVCQLAASRFATAAAATVVLGLFLLNSLSRQIDALAGWRWLSPFRYYDLSQPLPPGGPFDVRGVEVLFGTAVVLIVAAALAFAYRDVGSPLVAVAVPSPPLVRDADSSPLWRAAVVRGLYDRRVALLLWTVGVAVMGMLFVVLTKSIVQPLLALASLRPYLNLFITGDIYPSFLSFIWFGIAQLLFAAYAISQVARWSAEDADGRLEAILSNPVSRRAVIVERIATLLVGALVIAAVSGAAVAVESRLQSIDLDTGKLATASLVLLPLTIFFAAIGAVLASRLPRAAVGLLGVYAFIAYFVVQLGPLFHWPDWTLDVSVFHLYGEPLRSGVDAGGLAIMLFAAAAGFVLAGALMQRRDIGA